MTETAETVIIDALQLILVQADEEPLEAPTAQTAIRALNRMMDSFAAEGINLGFTTVSNLNSPMTVPAGALEGIISNLAARLAIQYKSSEIRQSVAALAAYGKETLRLISGTMSATEFPSTLPRGSGNDIPDYQSQHFYNDLEDTILSEGTGAISQESDTYDDVNN